MLVFEKTVCRPNKMRDRRLAEQGCRDARMAKTAIAKRIKMGRMRAERGPISLCCRSNARIQRQQHLDGLPCPMIHILCHGRSGHLQQKMPQQPNEI
jgi:hypothetical protein